MSDDYKIIDDGSADMTPEMWAKLVEYSKKRRYPTSHLRAFIEGDFVAGGMTDDDARGLNAKMTMTPDSMALDNERAIDTVTVGYCKDCRHLTVKDEYRMYCALTYDTLAVTRDFGCVRWELRE